MNSITTDNPTFNASAMTLNPFVNAPPPYKKG
jgi:hypothetical protein